MLEGPILQVSADPNDAAVTWQAFADHTAPTLVVAADAETALQLLLPTDDEHRLTPAVVLIDLQLPTMSGLELVRTLRADERTAALAIIVLANRWTDEQHRAVYHHGAQLTSAADARILLLSAAQREHTATGPAPPV